MKRKHDLLKEKSKTRDAVGQISSWCLLIALHQRFGVGADRMERIAGKAEKLQKEIAAIIDEHGTAAGIAEMQRRLDGICFTEMRVPLNRNTKNRREVELRMAADQTVTAMWCCFALAIHQTLGIHNMAVHAALWGDGGIPHTLPAAALVVYGLVGLVGRAHKAGAYRAVVVGNDLCGCLTGDACEFDFNAEVLVLDGNHCGGLP